MVLAAGASAWMLVVVVLTPDDQGAMRRTPLNQPEPDLQTCMQDAVKLAAVYTGGKNDSTVAEVACVARNDDDLGFAKPGKPTK
jgi:hypothetical protein